MGLIKECNMCGVKVGALDVPAWRGHYFTCGSERCLEAAGELMREWERECREADEEEAKAQRKADSAAWSQAQLDRSANLLADVVFGPVKR